MENKNFMTLTEDELYDVNGGQGVRENYKDIAVDVVSVIYNTATGNYAEALVSATDAFQLATMDYVSSDTDPTKKKTNKKNNSNSSSSSSGSSSSSSSSSSGSSSKFKR